MGKTDFKIFVSVCCCSGRDTMITSPCSRKGPVLLNNDNDNDDDDDDDDDDNDNDIDTDNDNDNHS